MLEQLHEMNDLLRQAVDLALDLPEGAGAGNGDEAEAVGHAIRIRLGILNDALGRRQIHPAKPSEQLALDQRIRELVKTGVDFKDP